MASKKRKTRKKRGGQTSKRGAGGGGGVSRRGSPKPGGPDPLKSMLLGALIFGLIALFFLAPVGGDTPFNHLLKAFDTEGADAGAPEQSQADPVKPAAKPPAQLAVKRSTPAPATVDRKARTAAPMEEVSEDEADGLDDLINKRTR